MTRSPIASFGPDRAAAADATPASASRPPASPGGSGSGEPDAGRRSQDAVPVPGGQIFIAFDGGSPVQGAILHHDGRSTALGRDDVARLNAATAAGDLGSAVAAVEREQQP